MKKLTLKKSLIILGIVLAAVSVTFAIKHKINSHQTEEYAENEEGENEEYDGPDKAAAFQQNRTKNVSTGKVSAKDKWKAIAETKLLKENASAYRTEATSWIERGPYIDAPGPSGNSRPPNTSTGGRMRSILVDSLDPTHKTIWAGSVAGGLWKTTDITLAPANWQLVNDFLSNLAVADICQDPTNGNIMYMATGESYFNSDAVQGVGVFKSTDHGVTWNLLPSTTNYLNSTRILCDYLGNIYLATNGNGLLRSTNGGTSWTTITPSGLSNRICDLEISSTAVAGRLHVVAGIFSTQNYRFTDIPITATSADWNTPNTPFVGGSQRAEIAVRGNVLYALPVNSAYQVPVIYKSTNGGNVWTPTDGQPLSNWASGQGWYSLSVSISPADVNQVIVGGLDCHKTSDGGQSWTKISSWVGTAGPYVHADQHDIAWYDNGTKLIFACDGGIHYSTNGGTTITDRNIGLRIKQFYSVAIHPTTTDYFIAGAQDNGTHQLTQPGLGVSTEITGGDGAYVAIDQDEPQYQFGAYVYNQYRRSTNGGANWTSINFSGSTGQFINPFGYDNVGNKLYACQNNGNYLRWDNPQTGNTNTIITIGAFNSAQVGAVYVSPTVPNRVFFGTTGGRVVQVDNADQAVPTELNISAPTMPVGNYVNCINSGNTEQNLVATFTNYGINNIWITTNGGTSWTTVDGNLPNMPVYWAIYNPFDNNKMIIATETGVWETDLLNGASTIWFPNTTFPNVRTDMLQYRASDKTIAAGTHGRGVWSAQIVSACTPPTISTQPTNTNACTSFSATFTVAVSTGAANYQWQESTGGPTFTNITNGVNYTGATTATLNVNNVTALQNGYKYRCIVSSTCTPVQSVTSNAGTLTVTPGITFVSQPSNSTICENANASFAITTTAIPTSYQWLVSTNAGSTYTALTNNATYSGVSGATLTITNAPITLQNNYYRCAIATSCGTINSNAGILTVNAKPIITQNPVNLTICANNTATFTTAATGAGLTYQWQESINNGATFTPIVGATAATYSYTAGLGSNNYQYRCTVSGTCTPAVTTTVAVLTVNAALSISASPNNSTICENTNTTFTVAVTGVVNNYQWQVSTDAGATYTNLTNTGIYSGANTATLTLTGATFAQHNYRYRCAVTGSCPTINSAAATLTINTAPVISSQPASASNICDGQSTSFTVAASGTNISYQWQINTGSGFVNLTNATTYTGVTTPTLSINNVNTLMSTFQYRCIISGTCSPVATTTISTLTVYTPVSITAQPVGTTICSTGNTSFSVTATGTTPSYQWQVNNGAGFVNIVGATNATLSLTNVTTSMNNNQYRCVVSGLAPCGFATSTAATLVVSAQPTISLSAAPYYSLLPGWTTTLTATTSLNPANVTYTWYRNNAPFTNNTNNYLVNVNNLGLYSVNVLDNTNGCTNTSATIIVKDSVTTKLFIYPSPNDGRFTVAYYNSNTTATTQTIVIYDEKGYTVYNNKFAVNQSYQLHAIDLRRNRGGVYYVAVYDNNNKRLAVGNVTVIK